MSSECGSCHKAWDGSEDFITCETCNLSFDLKCSNMTKTIFTMMNGTANLSWRCFKCKNSAFKTVSLQIKQLQNTLNVLSEAFKLFSERCVCNANTTNILQEHDKDITIKDIKKKKSKNKKNKKTTSKPTHNPTVPLSIPTIQPSQTQCVPNSTAVKRKSTDSPSPHVAKKVRSENFVTPCRPILATQNRHRKPLFQRVSKLSAKPALSSATPIPLSDNITRRSNLMAAISVDSVFISQCGRSSSTDDILLHASFGLKDNNVDVTVANMTCKEITPKIFVHNGVSRSFKLSVPSEYMEHVSKSSFWPPGILVRPFKNRRKN